MNRVPDIAVDGEPAGQYQAKKCWDACAGVDVLTEGLCRMRS